eukprot:jgi/Ulvmu1/3618/UM017_0030.1
MLDPGPPMPTAKYTDDPRQELSMDRHMSELPAVDDLEVVAEIAEAELAELRKITEAVDVLREQQAYARRVAPRARQGSRSGLVRVVLTCTGDVVHVQMLARPQNVRTNSNAHAGEDQDADMADCDLHAHDSVGHPEPMDTSGDSTSEEDTASGTTIQSLQEVLDLMTSAEKPIEEVAGPLHGLQISDLPPDQDEIKITESDPIVQVGRITSEVDGVYIVKGFENSPAMDSGSVFCDERRTVLGRVLEVFGQVTEPCYAVQRHNAASADAARSLAASDGKPGEPPPTVIKVQGDTRADAGKPQVGMHVYAVTVMSAAVDLSALRGAAPARDFEVEVEGEDVDDEEDDVEGAAQPEEGAAAGAPVAGDGAAQMRPPRRGAADAASAAARHGRGGRRGCREADGPGGMNAEVALNGLGGSGRGRGRGRGVGGRADGRGRGAVKARRRGRGSEGAAQPGPHSNGQAAMMPVPMQYAVFPVGPDGRPMGPPIAVPPGGPAVPVPAFGGPPEPVAALDLGVSKDPASALPCSPEERDCIKTAVDGPPVSSESASDGNSGSTSEHAGHSGTRKRRLSVVPPKGTSSQHVDNERRAEDFGLLSMTLDSHDVICSMACLSVAGREPGFEKTNQDYVVVHPGPEGGGDQHEPFVFGVLDGHGVEGHHVSQLAGDRIRAAVVPGATALDSSADVGGLLWDMFSSVHAALASGAHVDCTFSGATATVSVLRGRTLTSAWVGDSRAVLGRREEGAVRAYDLTNDHKPDLPEEHARIAQSGGRVEPLLDEMNQPIGPPRVWLSDAWMPGLAMSRSLGDTLAASCGVTCCPDVSVVHITPDDVLAIWASDGVWEFISSQEAVTAVAGCADAAAAAQLLVALAQEQWAQNEADVSDDISCAVVFFSGRNDADAPADMPVERDGASAAMAGLSLADAADAGVPAREVEPAAVPHTAGGGAVAVTADSLKDEFGIRGSL